MEKLSDNLKRKLRALAQAWNSEREEGEEIWITSSTITFERKDSIETIELSELIAIEEIPEESTLLEKCKQDLDRRGAQSFHFPEYKDQEESERLGNLIRTLDKSSFRRKTATERLEIHYYLGEVLTSRG